MGSTPPPPPAPVSPPNHSHVCGINFPSGALSQTVDESFPRMWDQLTRDPAIKVTNRIIPTYVGSTVTPYWQGSGKSNHSHVCGINRTRPLELVRCIESFPRMWDQPDATAGTSQMYRIIPTYVGSTRLRSTLHRFAANHSHVCGINASLSMTMFLIFESFPRMWDQLGITPQAGWPWRIIPTYVGSTLRRSSTAASSSNHSHVCGINAIRFSIHCALFESFPRMWDQRVLLCLQLLRLRIIPTYVGSTCVIEIFKSVNTNHSHVCGINLFLIHPL